MAKQILQGGGEYFDTTSEINAKLEPIQNSIEMLDNEIDTLSKDTVSLSKTTTQTLKSPLSITNDLMINGDTNAFKIEVNENGSALLNSNDLIFDKLPKTNDETSYDDLADNQLVTKKMVKEQSSGGSSSINDKYGIQADYATHYGILDCPNGLIDTNITNKTITINPGIVLKLAGADGKTVLASKQTYDIEESEKLILFLAKTSDTQLGFLEAGEVFYQEEEPTNGVTSYLAWWKPSRGKWQFKSVDTGNVWREAIATPIANITINESNTGVLNIDYIGYRIIDDDIIAQMSDIDSIEDKIQTINTNVNTLSDTVDAYGYLINQDRQEITNLKNNKADKTSLGTMANKDASDYSTTTEANSLYASKTLEATVNTLSGNVEELMADVEANSQDIAGFINELENKADKSTIPTKTSQLVNDSNYTNKVYVDGEIAKIKQFSYTIVSTLPTTGQANTIYLVSKTDESTGDVYNEYMWINSKWELIGTTAVDLNGYATEDYVDTKVGEEATARESAITTLTTTVNTKADKSTTYTKTEVNTELAKKATKATTLSGYGITDAYTKTQTDNLLANKANISSLGTMATKNASDYSTTIEADDLYAEKSLEETVSTLNTTVNGKADKATTLAGYGITNAYTKAEVNAYINNKVDKVTGKGLSTNDYTTTEKNKLAGIASGAEVNTITSIKVNNVAQTITNKSVNITVPDAYAKTETYTKTETNNLLANKVDKETGKVLSSNDFTNEEKTKLDGIQAGAQVNKIETIAVNGTNQTITNKRVNITVPTTTSQLTNNSGYITSTQANKSYVSKTGYYPYSQEADEALSKVSRWSDYSTTLLSLAAANLFEAPIDTNASDIAINDTLGRLLRITKAGNIGFFEMDLRYIGNISANNRVPVAEIPSDMRPLHKYTRIPAKIIVESNISVDAPLAVYIEINKEDSIIYLYNNLAFYANQYLGPRIMCSGSYVLGSMTV